MEYFIFGNVDTRSYNIHIFPLNIDLAPEVYQQQISVPGKHGNLLAVNRRFENVTHRYTGVIYQNAESNLAAFRSAIMKYDGYAKLTDSILTDEFYQARYAGGLEPDLALGRDMVKFVIEFDRKPQRFLLSGEEITSITSSYGSLSNPTPFPSKPLIRIYGNGTVGVGGKSITVTGNPYSYVDVDCEMMDCFYGATNLNSKVSLPGFQFPTLGSGSVGISRGSGVSRVDITPRWWRV